MVDREGMAEGNVDSESHDDDGYGCIVFVGIVLPNLRKG